ncbi:MAG: DUF1836 domain-containing protein, partial [Eggerthellaceae bacterium]|nr:DUF1836 domain-containing protein [Eggerthellaceae bacterium]
MNRTKNDVCGGDAMAKPKDAEEQRPHECAQISLPAWADFPDIELYMDQVLSLMARYL